MFLIYLHTKFLIPGYNERLVTAKPTALEQNKIKVDTAAQPLIHTLQKNYLNKICIVYCDLITIHHIRIITY